MCNIDSYIVLYKHILTCILLVVCFSCHKVAILAPSICILKATERSRRIGSFSSKAFMQGGFKIYWKRFEVNNRKGWMHLWKVEFDTGYVTRKEVWKATRKAFLQHYKTDWWMIIPNIWKKMFQTTNQKILIVSWFSVPNNKGFLHETKCQIVEPGLVCHAEGPA